MPQDENITTKFKVDISDLKAGISQANQQIKLANAQFKAASAGMDDWQKSSEGIKAKLSQLDSILAAQKQKLQAYVDQLKRQQDAYAENGKKAEALKAKLQELADQGVSKTSSEYKEYEKALQAVEKEQLSNQKAINDLNVTILNQEAAVNSTEKDIRNYNTELDNLEKESEEADKATDDLDDSLDDIGESANKASGGFSVLKGALASLLADGIRVGISAIKDFAKETIEVGKKFESSMSNVAALSGATGDELEMLRDTAKKFGSETKFSASEAADALGYMALAGWDAQQSADALGGVLNLAAASGMDLAEASDMVTDYMSAFSMGAEKSGYFADVLAYAQANANTTAEGLGEAFKNCAANMNASGQDFETTTSLLAMMANQGMKGSTAGTALSAVMRDITKKMEDGAIAIGDTAVQVMDADGNFRDLTDILWDVEQATNGMGDAQKASALSSTFTADSIKGLNMILNAGVDTAIDFEEKLRTSSMSLDSFEDETEKAGIDLKAMKKAFEKAGVSSEDFNLALEYSGGSAEKFKDTLNEWVDSGYNADDIIAGLGVSMEGLQSAMDNSAGSAEEMSRVMNDNLEGDMTALGSKLEGVQIALYEKLEPALRAGVGLLSGLVDAFGWVVDHSDGFISAVTTVAQAIIQWFQQAWEKIKEIWDQVQPYFAALWEGIKVVFSVVVEVLGAFFQQAWETIQAVWEQVQPYFAEVWENIKTVFSTVVEVLGGFFTQAWETIKAVWEVVQPYFAALWEAIKAIFSVVVEVLGGYFRLAWESIKFIWDAVVSYFSMLWENVKLIFSAVQAVLSGDFSGAWEAIKQIWGNVVGWFSDRWDGIKNIFASVKTWFSDKFGAAWNAIKEKFSPIKKFFQDTWDGIKKVFKPVGDFFSTTFGTARDAILAPLNFIIRGLNKLIRGLNSISFSIPSWVPGIGGTSFGIHIPEIPELARGGVLKRGQMGLLEGTGAEAVVPLERNKQWIHSVAADMLREMGFTAEGTGDISQSTSSVQNFTQNIYAPQQPSRIELYRQTRNLLALAKGVG